MTRWLLGALAALFLLLAGCTAGGDAGDQESAGGGTAADESAGDQQTDPAGTVTVYSGRSEELVGPILEQFSEDTGIETEVRYGDTAEMAATILEEGANSPADLFFGQDAGALGALEREGRLVELPQDVLEPVDTRFRSPDGTWVGISGRARTIAYNTDRIAEDDLPDSVLDLTEPEWEGRVGWAPPNGSFQAFVTAMRVEMGDEATHAWLEGMEANGVTAYENNTAQVEAVGRGEVDLALVNHYYLYRFLEEDPTFPVENYFLSGGDVGALVNVAGVGILDTAEGDDAALALVEYLLTEDAQKHFAEETFEFPLVAGVQGDERLPSIEEIDAPDLDLSDLDDLEGTLQLMREAGVLH